jgi:adenine phosphoribosyltransferase
MDLKRYITDVPDFPKAGIVFKDITPLMGDAAAFRETIRALAEPWKGKGIHLLVAAEARGFIFGGALATELGAGLVPVRKAGKLPRKTVSAKYALEYGTDELHMHEDAIAAGSKVLVVDDVLATGGTA